MPRAVNGPSAPNQVPFPAQSLQSAAGPASKDAAAAASLNFFLPGTGRAYLGAGRPSSGPLIFVAYVIDADASFVANILTYAPASSPTSASPHIYIFHPVFLLPFAFAYDGHRRAKQA